MRDIYLSREEKKKIQKTMQMGEKAGKKVREFMKKVSDERDKNFFLMSDMHKKTE